MDNYFTIKSANEMLPTIIEKFQKIKQEKNEVEKIEQKFYRQFFSHHFMNKHPTNILKELALQPK